MKLPILSHCGASLDHDPSSWQVRVAVPTRLCVAAHSMVTVFPVGEAAQLTCVESSTVKAGHSGEKWH